MIAPPYEWTFRRVVWATIIFVFAAISFWLLFRFGQVIFIFFIAMVIGTVIRPIVTWLYLHGMPRYTGTILVYLLLLAMVIGFVLLVFPVIAEQGGKIVAALPGYYQNFYNWMVNNPNPMIYRLSLLLPTTLPVMVPALQTGAEALASAEQLFGYVVSVTKVIFIVTGILLLSFHWSLYGTRAIQSLVLMLPISQRERTRELISEIETKMSAFVTGQAILCLAIGILAMIAYLLVGLPNALVLAFIAGVLEAVPMLGPVLGAIPASIVALSIGPSKLIWIIVATIVIQQAENSLLVPRVMRRAVGVNPFVSLLSLFAFGSLFGIAGAFMAIPIAAIVQLLLNRFVFNPESKELEPSMGRDYASRLRYEAQDLIQDLRKQARHKRGGSDMSVRQIDQLIDEIEAITTDLDAFIAEDQNSGAG